MAPDSVMPVAQPAVTLAVPADGRVNGYQFAGHVLGAATGTAMPGPQGLRSGPGQQLWLFGLRWSADATDSSGDPANVTATVVADNARLRVPLTQPQSGLGQTGSGARMDSGPEYFLASVPSNARDVAVELATAGFVQDFSLTHMAREGHGPDALYRDQSSWRVTDQTNAEKDLATPYQQQGWDLPDAKLAIQLPTVSLSYFGPDGATDTAPAPDQAWLIPDLQDPLPAGWITKELEYTTAITPNGLTLTIPGQAPIHPKVLSGGPDQSGGGDGHNGVFTGQYAFPVPAELTTATLNVDVGPQSVFPAYSGADPATVTPGPATFPITLPAPTPPAPPAGASDQPAKLDSATLATANATGSLSPGHTPGSGFSIWLLVLGLAVVAGAAAALILLRRRGWTFAPVGVSGAVRGTWAPAAGEQTPVSTRPDPESPDADPGPAESGGDGLPADRDQTIHFGPPSEPARRRQLVELPQDSPPPPEGVVEVQLL